jgi:hypothetical protein
MVIRIAGDLAELERSLAAADVAVKTTAGSMEDELEQAVQETLAKFEHLGNEAPAELAKVDRAIQNVGTSADTTAPSIAALETETAAAASSGMTFKQSFDQVDKSLSAVGVNLGPLPGAITELGSAAGKTATEIGALGTAGLVFASAMAGWNIGTKIGEWTGWTQAIADNTAKLLGWGDVAAVEAAEGAHTLATASEIAGRQITSMDEAIRIITKNTADYTDKAKTNAAELGRVRDAAEKAAEFSNKLFSMDDLARADTYLEALGGIENLTKLTKDKKEELRKALDEALTAYTALGLQAPSELKKVYDATTELVAVTRSFSDPSSGMWATYAAGLDDAAAKTEVATAQMGLAVKAQEAPWRDLGGVSRAELEAIAATAAEKYATALAHSEHFTEKQIADFQRAAEAARLAADSYGTYTLDTYEGIGAKADETADRQVAAVERVALSWGEAMDAVAAGEGTMSGTVGPAVKPANMSDSEWNLLQTNPRAWEIQHGWDWSHAAEGPNAFAMTGATSSSSSSSTTQTVNVNTVMGDKNEIARIVKEALAADWRAQVVRA